MSDMRKRIEHDLGLEPSFGVIDTKLEGQADPRKRYEVIDAECEPICLCTDSAYAELIRDLLEQATEPNRERAAWARLVATMERYFACGDGDVTDEYKAVAEAREALRCLGVDVDSLLSESAAHDALIVRGSMVTTTEHDDETIEDRVARLVTDAEAAGFSKVAMRSMKTGGSLAANRIEEHARAHKAALKGWARTSEGTNGYLSGLADAAKIARGEKVPLPSSD